MKGSETNDQDSDTSGANGRWCIGRSALYLGAKAMSRYDSEILHCHRTESDILCIKIAGTMPETIRVEVRSGVWREYEMIKRKDRSHFLKRYEVTVRFYDHEARIGCREYTEIYEFMAEGIVNAVDLCTDFFAGCPSENWSIDSVSLK